MIKINRPIKFYERAAGMEYEKSGTLIAIAVYTKEVPQDSLILPTSTVTTVGAIIEDEYGEQKIVEHSK